MNRIEICMMMKMAFRQIRHTFLLTCLLTLALSFALPAMSAFASTNANGAEAIDSSATFVNNSTFSVYSKPVSVTYRLPVGKHVTHSVAYEIAKRTTDPLETNNIVMEHKGHVTTPVFTQAGSGTTVTFSGDYTASERQSPDGSIQKTGTRTLKVVETRTLISKHCTASVQIIHDFEYIIENNLEYLAHHRERFYQTSQRFQSGKLPESSYFHGPTTTHALIKDTSRSFDAQEHLTKITRDKQTRKTLFNRDGSVLTDKTENTFSSEDAADQDSKVQTYYQRETSYREDNLPINIRVTQKTLSPRKSHTVKTLLQWQPSGDLELAQIEEFDGRKAIANKSWIKSRRTNPSQNAIRNTLTDSGVVQLTRLIKFWEENFVNNQLPVSPYAYPFFIL